MPATTATRNSSGSADHDDAERRGDQHDDQHGLRDGDDDAAQQRPADQPAGADAGREQAPGHRAEEQHERRGADPEPDGHDQRRHDLPGSGQRVRAGGGGGHRVRDDLARPASAAPS